MRKLFSGMNTIFGANIFYDYRNAPHAAFHQVGAGIEAFLGKWDFHGNGYFPVNRTKKVFQNGFYKFEGHQAIFQKHYQLALTGGEASIGRELFATKYIDLHAKIGGYYFKGHFDKKAGGGLFRLKSNITSYFSIEGQASYDSLFKDVYQGMVSLNLPFGKRAKPQTLYSCNPRSMQAVDRFEMIVTKKHRETAKAINPETGNPLFFVFVNNTHPSSDGSINSPFPTLLEAQNNSFPNDVIYVFAGDGTTKGMDQGIILQQGQQLLGSGTPHRFTTRFGQEIIPSQTKTMPFITNNTGTPVIALASNNVVSGFNLKYGTGVTGIFGNGIQNAAILHNNFIDLTTAQTGLFLQASGGNILIANNIFGTTNQPNGISAQILSTSSTNLAILNNSFASTIVGVTVLSQNVTPITFNMDISHNTMLGMPGLLFNANGLIVHTVSFSDVLLNVLIEDNASSNCQTAMSFIADNSTGLVSGNVAILNNTTSNIQLSGLSFRLVNNALLTADVENNQFLNSSIFGLGSGVNFIQQAGQLALKLVNNNSTTFNNAFNGYSLQNASSFPMVVQSPNALLTGVASENAGTSATPNSTTKFGAIGTIGTIEYLYPPNP